MDGGDRGAWVSREEHQRVVDELQRANRRLSGTLQIVLDTLDSADVGTLFSRVLEEITETVESTGTIVYLAEQDGYHLRGTSSALADVTVVRFVPFDRALESLAIREGGALRLQVLAPQREELRQGRLEMREVRDEATGDVHRYESELMPPFASFYLVPVWFGGHVVALLVVGWSRSHPLAADDAELLDAVARYLSVQLVGAFSALRSQREAQLKETATRIRERLLERRDLDREALAEAYGMAATELACMAAPIAAGHEGLAGAATAAGMSADARAVVSGVAVAGARASAGAGPAAGKAATDASAAAGTGPTASGTALAGTRDAGAAIVPGVPTVLLPIVGERALPANLIEPLPVGEEVQARAIAPRSALARWLEELGEPSAGAILDVGTAGGEPLSCLFLRGTDEEPMDDLELAFLDDIGHDIVSVARGDEARSQDKAISQALQTGMKNELQKVPGLSAEAVYSSATAAAFVGGDFYDLIRLPGQRACVIMGDVSGKGVEAASVSAAVKTALGAYAWEGLQPAHMVRLLNDFLLGFSRLETFATLFVGIVDLRKRLLTYCSAGHPPALLLRSSTHELETLGVQSGVVGAFSSMRYHDGRVRVGKGDLLVLYTDGTTEARSPDGGFFGEEGLRDALHDAVGEGFDGLAGRLLETLDDYTGRQLADDVAILALRFDSPARNG